MKISPRLLHITGNLLAQGVSYERLEALGLEYRVIARLLRGEFASEAQMLERLKYAIHDFTRRQLSWFRRDTRITWLEGGSALEEQATQVITTFLQNQQERS